MKRTSVVSGLLVVALAALVALLAWRSRGWPLVHDAPIMHYVAWRLLDGAVPYRDVFDMNFPGVYLLHAAVLGTLGGGDAAWRVFDLAWLAGTATAAGAFAAAWGRAAAWGAALFFAAYHLAGGAWQAGQRDFLLCPFLLLGALGVARWLERRRSASLAWAGVALGAGLTVKPQAALFVAALAVVVLLAAWRDGAARPLAAFAVPAALPLAAVVAGVALLGGLPAWRAVVVDYLLPLYSRVGRPARWGFYRDDLWIPVAAAVGLSVVAAIRRRAAGPRHLVAGVGLAYGLVHYFAQGKGWEYHAYPAAAFAAVLVFAELGAALAAGSRPLGAGLVASLVAVIVLLGGKGVEAGDAPWIREKLARVDAVVAAIDGRLRAGERVQVLDTTDGGVHALFRLRALQPTRFLYDFHFLHDETHPTIRALRAEFARALAARPPRFVVLFRQGWPAGGFERVARFPELADLLERTYARDRMGDGWILYAKRDDS